MFLLTHWPHIDRWSVVSAWKFPGADKLVHFSLYAGWAVLWWWVLTGGVRRLTRTQLHWLVAGGLAYALFDEATQAIVGRHPNWFDVLADVAGVMTAGLLLHLWIPPRRSSFPRRPGGR